MKRKQLISAIIITLIVTLFIGCGMSEQEKAIDAQNKLNAEVMSAFDFSTVNWGEKNDDYINDNAEDFYTEYVTYYGTYSDEMGRDRNAVYFSKDELKSFGLDVTDEEQFYMSAAVTTYLASGTLGKTGYQDLNDIWNIIHENPYIDLTAHTHTPIDIVSIWTNLGLTDIDNESEFLQDELEDANLEQDAETNDEADEYFQELNSYYNNLNFDDVYWGGWPGGINEEFQKFIEITNCYYGVYFYEDDCYPDYIIILYPEQIKSLLSLDDLPSDNEAFLYSMFLLDELVVEDAASYSVLQDEMQFCWEFVEGSKYIDNLPGAGYVLPDENVIKSQYAENANIQLGGIKVEPGISFELYFPGYEDGSGTPYTIEIESFEITDVDDRNNQRIISYELVGITDSERYPTIKFSCYDDDGYSLGDETLILDVNAGENFKLSKKIYAPLNTTKIVIHL